jgi:hypothetical protein
MSMIGIVGDGISGLAIASMLADQDQEVTVFDQFDQPRPVGSGFVIHPIGHAALDNVGAGDLARAKGNMITRMLGHVMPSGRRVLDVNYDQKQRGLAIHQASLFDALFVAAKTRNIFLQSSAAIVSITNKRLTTADGRGFGPFDLVIDSAGKGSPLSPIASHPLAYGAIWGTVDGPTQNCRWTCYASDIATRTGWSGFYRLEHCRVRIRPKLPSFDQCRVMVTLDGWIADFRLGKMRQWHFGQTLRRLPHRLPTPPR